MMRLLKLFGAWRALQAVLPAAGRGRMARGLHAAPGQNWGTVGTAMGAISAARGIRSPALRKVALVVGGVLVLRAVFGRGGAKSTLHSRPTNRF